MAKKGQKKPAARQAAKKTAKAKKPSGKTAAKRGPAAKRKAAPTRKPAQGRRAQAPSPGSGAQRRPRPTMSHMLGEVVWLLAQSRKHRHFALSDLEWMVAPPLALRQYRVFRDNNRPVGVAFWAYVGEETDRKLTEGNHRLRPDEWKSGETLWLIDLVSPFSKPEKKYVDAMLTDLVQNPFKGKPFKFATTDRKTGKRKVAEFKPKPDSGAK